MSLGVRAERGSWLKYFNPCGIEPVKGFVHQTCVSPDCMRVQCMSEGAYVMARYLLNEGTSIESERAEFEKHLRSRMLGNEVVRVSGKTVRVSKENIAEIVDEVVKKAAAIVEEVDMCVQMSTPLSDDYLAECTVEQRDVLNRLGDKVRFLENYREGRDDVNRHEAEMQQIVEEALALGLGEVGLVARYAIGFGLGERVPQYSMSQIFEHPGMGQLKERPR